jgi:TonB family protein
MTQASPQAKPQPPAATFEPVVITAKPDPVYTAEARRLQIQGEVVVRVVFTSAGRVQVAGVQQGLGHGLDEAAERAVEQIQFKPARRGGQPRASRFSKLWISIPANGRSRTASWYPTRTF